MNAKSTVHVRTGNGLSQDGYGSPPRGRSPPQDEANGQHNWDITIINGPRHSSPNFARNFLGQQRQARLPPTIPQEPRRSYFVGHPSFIRPHARSDGGTQYLRFPSTYLVDHDSTPRSVDAAVQDCAVHVAVDAFTLGHHCDCLCTVNVFVTPPASQANAHGAFGTLASLPIPVTAISQDFKDFTKGQIPGSISALHTQGPHVLMRVCTCPP